jgi:hypothetical protein
MGDGVDETLVMGVSAKTGLPLPGATTAALSSMAVQEGKPDSERSILASRAAPLRFGGVVSAIGPPSPLNG